MTHTPISSIARRPLAASISAPPAHEGLSEAARALWRARTLAYVLDTRYRVPGTSWRFGFDALIGIVPIAGDTLASVLSLYPILEGRRLHVRKRAIARMLLNVGVDWLVGLVPLVGFFFDAAYKANVKNLRVLERELFLMYPKLAELDGEASDTRA